MVGELLRQLRLRQTATPHFFHGQKFFLTTSKKRKRQHRCDCDLFPKEGRICASLGCLGKDKSICSCHN